MDQNIEGIDKIMKGSNMAYTENINIKKNLVTLEPSVLKTKIQNATFNKNELINIIKNL